MAYPIDPFSPSNLSEDGSEDEESSAYLTSLLPPAGLLSRGTEVSSITPHRPWIGGLPGPLSTSDQPLFSGSSLMSQMEPLSPTASQMNSGENQSASTSQPLFSPGQTYMSPGLHSYQSGISSLPGPLSTSDQPLSSGSSLMSQMEPLSPTASHFNSGDHQSASTSQPLFSPGQTFMSPGLHSYQRGTSLPGVQPLSTGQSLMPLSASSNQQPFSSGQAMLSSTGDSNLVLNYLAIIFHLNHHFI